jgi:hypothetical protein
MAIGKPSKQYDHPECTLVGGDGNAFAIIGAVTKALQKAKQPDMAREFRDFVMSNCDYDELLATAMEYVEVA